MASKKAGEIGSFAGFERDGAGEDEGDFGAWIAGGGFALEDFGRDDEADATGELERGRLVAGGLADGETGGGTGGGVAGEGFEAEAAETGTGAGPIRR